MPGAVANGTPTNDLAQGATSKEFAKFMRVPPILSLCILLGLMVTACGTNVKTVGSHHQSSAGTPPLSLVTTWGAHTRSLQIQSDGAMVEIIDNGCCLVYIHMKMTFVSAQIVDLANGTITTRVTEVVTGTEWPLPGAQTPKIGQQITLMLKRGVLFDPITTGDFCSRAVQEDGSYNCGA